MFRTGNTRRSGHRLLGGLCLLGALLLSTPAVAGDSRRPVLIGVNDTVLIQDSQAQLDWQRYLSQRLDRPVELVYRENYRQMIDLVKDRKIDFAWLNDYSYFYLARRGRVRLLATPLYRGRPTQPAYLVVPSSDVSSRTIEDLRGRVFAFVDPYSFSGHYLPRHWLRQLGELEVGRFFRKTFFAFSDRNLIAAVAAGLADGGMVGGYAWETVAREQPELARLTRVAARSDEYGFPPLVAVPSVSGRDLAAMRAALLGMADHPEGRRLLRAAGLDGFEAGNPATYRRVTDVAKRMEAP